MKFALGCHANITPFKQPANIPAHLATRTRAGRRAGVSRRAQEMARGRIECLS